MHTDDLQSIKERYNYYERNDIIMYFWRESFKGSLFSKSLFNLVPSSNKCANSNIKWKLNWFCPFFENETKLRSNQLQKESGWLNSQWKLFSKDHFKFHKVPSSRPVYYSILNSFGKRSQYIRIKIPLHKQSEYPWMCY